MLLCTLDFILGTKALLHEDPSSTPDEVREYLSGNLCRCGSYSNIMEAVLAAAETAREARTRPP